MRIGGTEMVIKNIIEGADASRFTMSVFCIEQPLGPWGEELQQEGIEVGGVSRQPGFDHSLIRAIRKKVKVDNIGILHCHQYTPYIYGVLACLGCKTKVLFTEHGRFYPDSSSWKRKLINPLLNIFTGATTAISAATKQALIDFENIAGTDIQVLYNGIADIDVNSQQTSALKKSLGVTDTEICLGTIARLDPIKNHRMMLDAFKIVISSDVNAKLMIVGDGEEMTNIKKQIEALDLHKHVILTGYESKPQHHLAMMDIYLLSSLSEGTSMTLLEAMSLGKPCIATDAGGNPEIVEHQYNGLVTANDNAQEFATAIITLCQNPALQKEMGQHSRKRYQQQFSLQSMVRSYQQLYAQLLQ